MDPESECARLPVIQPTTGIDRHNGVWMIQACRIVSGPVAGRGTVREKTRNPLPDVPSGHSTQEPRRSSEEVLSRDSREGRTQLVRRANAIPSPEHFINLCGILATNRFKIRHVLNFAGV